MPNASIATVSDAKKTLKNIRISNIDKLIFEHLNFNSLRNKFDFLCKQIKGSIDIFMISETKRDDSIQQSQWRYIVICMTKVLSHDFPCAESFFVEIILHKK